MNKARQEGKIEMSLVFQNIGEDELDSIFGETSSSETHGEWYYQNVTHFGGSIEDEYRNRHTHNGTTKSQFLEEFKNKISNEANEHYKNRRAIYHDSASGCTKVGVIEKVELVVGAEAGGGGPKIYNTLDGTSKNWYDENAELSFLIGDKLYDCIHGVCMIEHELPMDLCEGERCFENFDDAVRALKKLNKAKENNE